MGTKLQHNRRKDIIQYGKATLKSADMLKLKSEFDFVRKNGVKVVGKYFLLVYSKTPDNKLRIGVIYTHIRIWNKHAVIIVIDQIITGIIYPDCLFVNAELISATR